MNAVVGNYFKKGLRINRILFSLVTSPPFLAVTAMSHGLVFFFSLIFYHLEFGHNENVTNFLDALWWGFATATTVGYGDIIPTSAAGKILGIFLMITGTALFATYTALFANAILEDEMIKFNILPSKEKTNQELLELLSKHKKDLDQYIKDIEE